MGIASTRCESCGLPVHSYRYCAHCTDEYGNLQSFDARLESIVAEWEVEHPHLTYHEAREQAKHFMAQMPAWRDHPRIVGLRRAEAGFVRRNDTVGLRPNDPVGPTHGVPSPDIPHTSGLGMGFQGPR